MTKIDGITAPTGRHLGCFDITITLQSYFMSKKDKNMTCLFDETSNVGFSILLYSFDDMLYSTYVNVYNILLLLHIYMINLYDLVEGIIGNKYYWKLFIHKQDTISY